MAKKLLSIRDENTILITIRFILSYNDLPAMLPVEYDFDLIVKNDITVDKLLKAIWYGLLNEAKIDKEEIKKIYQMDFYSTDIRYDFSEDIKKLTKIVIDYNDSERDIYMKCLGIFLKCYESYICDNNYEIFLPDADNFGFRREALHKAPHITVDCIDVNKWKKISKEKDESDTVISISDVKMFQLGKSKLFGKTLEEIGFVTSTRIVFTDYDAGVQADEKDVNVFLFQSQEMVKVDEYKELILKNEGVRDGYKETIPLYNISNRPLYQLNTEPVKIIPPTEPPKKNNGNIVKSMISPILMSVMSTMMMFSRGFMNSSSNKWMSGIYGAAGIITILMTIWNGIDQQKIFKKSLNDWKNHYEKYIQRIIYDIVTKQECDIKQLKVLYPSMLGLEKGDDGEYPSVLNVGSIKKTSSSLVDMCAEIHPDIFTRGKEHPDFLTIRIGISTEDSELVSSVFSVVGEKKDYVFTSERYMNLGNSVTYPFTILLNEKEDFLYIDDIESEKRKKELDAQNGKGYLIDLPSAIADKYAYLIKAPVLLKLRECETLGIVLPKGLSFYPILDNIIMNLSFYHSPDDVQMVLFCEDFSENTNLSYLTGADNCNNQWIYRQNIIDKYKHLPHFRELLGDMSAFVFDETAASMVFNRLYEIISSREDVREPHIVLIFQEEYKFKRHPISEFLPEYSEKNDTEQKNNHKLSFIFCKNYEEELPKYCGQVIVAEKEKKEIENLDNAKYENYNWYIYPHTQIISRSHASEIPSIKDKKKYSFVTDDWNVAVRNLDNRKNRLKLYSAYKTLSAIYYYRIAQGVGVPGYVELFDLIEASSENQKIFDMSTEENEKDILQIKIKNYIQQQWCIYKSQDDNKQSYSKLKRDVTESLAVPIGKKSDKELIYLDLHEKADGPHMLVAGTTGSGKTETILTYLIELCTLYTPEQVNLLLMDMKGAGFVKRIGKLPHVVGKVTDVDGDETGTGTVYMLKRFLHSMSAEVKRRKLLLSKMDVDSVDGYIRAKNDLESHIENHAQNLKINRNTEEGQKRIEELKNLPQLAHLFVVVDEFTELMRFTGDNAEVDFRAEITSLARVGRSLGFHIILISQNIENAITPDIRVNSKARLCLKVATREASKEMIGSDRAADAHMPGNGRAYLLVGTGSRFEYFQSGYSGADIIRNLEQPYQVTWAQMNGQYTMFFDSEENEKLKAEYSALPETDSEKAYLLPEDENILNKEEILDSIRNDASYISEGKKKEKSKITQISLVCEQIIQCYKEENMEKPHQVFQAPLPMCCYYEMNWKDGKGTGMYKELKKPVDERIKRGGLI